MNNNAIKYMKECKAGSQYDTGGASVMSVANIVRESIFTTQILFLMSNFQTI